MPNWMKIDRGIWLSLQFLADFIFYLFRWRRECRNWVQESSFEMMSVWRLLYVFLQPKCRPIKFLEELLLKKLNFFFFKSAPTICIKFCSRVDLNKMYWFQNAADSFLYKTKNLTMELFKKMSLLKIGFNNFNQI